MLAIASACGGWSHSSTSEPLHIDQASTWAFGPWTLQGQKATG
jgi:hypothetical protein